MALLVAEWCRHSQHRLVPWLGGNGKGVVQGTTIPGGLGELVLFSVGKEIAV